jgi:hypothetical protein
MAEFDGFLGVQLEKIDHVILATYDQMRKAFTII